MVIPRQAEIWWAETEAKRRPVLVVTRDEAIEVLRRIVVAPVTRTVRGIPTEVPLGPADGLPVECAASLDNVQPIERATLTSRIGRLEDRESMCRALSALADC